MKPPFLPCAHAYLHTKISLFKIIHQLIQEMWRIKKPCNLIDREHSRLWLENKNFTKHGNCRELLQALQALTTYFKVKSMTQFFKKKKKKKIMFEPSCHVLCKIGQTKSIATKSDSTRYEHLWSPKVKEEIWKIWQNNSEQICKQPLIKKVRKVAWLTARNYFIMLLCFAQSQAILQWGVYLLPM